MPITNWSDRDFDDLLRRASELGRNRKDSQSSIFTLRAALNACQTKHETTQRPEVWGPVRLAVWSVLVLAGIAGVGFLVILRVKL